jgi:multisubunit Na+/H+ antiporter MnhG subunit
VADRSPIPASRAVRTCAAVRHKIAIAIFIAVATPVTYMLLLPGAVRREFSGDGS